MHSIFLIMISSLSLLLSLSLSYFHKFCITYARDIACNIIEMIDVVVVFQPQIIIDMELSAGDGSLVLMLDEKIGLYLAGLGMEMG